LSEFLERLEPLPLQLSTPVFEELARPRFAVVVPQLGEGFLQQIGRVQPLVGAEQKLEILARIAAQVLWVREQRILLPLDECALLASQTGVLLLANLIERLVQVP